MIIDILLPASLAFIMFSLGIGLTLDDFKNVAKNPKAFTVGLINQMLLLPLVTYCIIRIFGIQGELAVGLMILAACPGGVTSGIVTKMAKGDTALSISFAAVVSIVTMITLPLIVGFSVPHFMGSEAPRINLISLGLYMFFLATVPVVFGVLINNKLPGFSQKFEPVASKISSGLFVLIIVGALASEWDTFVNNLTTLGPLLVALILTMLLIGYFSSRMLKVPEEQASAVAIATGIQNGTMGITIGNLIMPVGVGLSAFALPSGVYGIFMYLVCLPVVFFYARWLRRRFAGGENA